VLGSVATRTRRQENEIATKWNQPIPILINIMSYADPETIRTLCCVSKQCYDLIYNDPGMKNNRAVPLLVIRPSLDHDDDKGRIGRLLRFLWHHRDKLQRIREIKIIDGNKFGGSISDPEWTELIKITDKLRLYGVISLDMYSLPPSTDIRIDDLGAFLPSMLPNLRYINLSNNGFGKLYLCKFSMYCPNLETITWHNFDRKQSVIINGREMMPATNLKEIYMDDSVFLFSRVSPRGRDKFLDLENDEHSDIFLFYQCSTKLERVSIRNAKWYVGEYINGEFRGETTVIPQNALIKFVRNAAQTLRWFRSDLTEDNMNMLRSERPGIEFV